MSTDYMHRRRVALGGFHHIYGENSLGLSQNLGFRRVFVLEMGDEYVEKESKYFRSSPASGISGVEIPEPGARFLAARNENVLVPGSSK